MIEFLVFLFGLIFGSFLNVLMYRLPRGESIVLPPSHCPGCQHRLGVWDLFPLFSFLFLGGRCRYCHAKISWQYPAVEFLTGILTLIWWTKVGAVDLSFQSIALLVLSYVLVVIAVIDLEQQIIPDVLTYPMIFLGFIAQGCSGSLVEAVLGLLTGAGILYLIIAVYPKGMGFGDVKFMAMTGVFLGWQKVLAILFLGSLFGVAWMVPVLLWNRKNRKTPFAFGPFLVLATLFVMYYWDQFLFIMFFK